MKRRSFLKRLATIVAAPFVAPPITHGLSGLTWTGFSPVVDQTRIVGQILYVGDIVVTAPRKLGVLYGITD